MDNSPSDLDGPPKKRGPGRPRRGSMTRQELICILERRVRSPKTLTQYIAGISRALSELKGWTRVDRSIEQPTGEGLDAWLARLGTDNDGSSILDHPSVSDGHVDAARSSVGDRIIREGGNGATVQQGPISTLMSPIVSDRADSTSPPLPQPTSMDGGKPPKADGDGAA